MNDRTNCLASHLKRIRILETAGVYNRDIASAYYEAASVLSSQGQVETAELYYLKCSEVGSMLNDKKLVAYPLLPLSELKVQRGDTVGAKADMRLGISMIKGEGVPIEPILLSDLANLLAAQDSTDEAEQCMKQAYELVGENGSDEVAAFVYVAAGQINNLRGDHKKALVEFKKAQHIWESENKFFYLPGVYMELATTFEKIHADSSIFYYKKFIKLNEQSHNEDNNTKLAEMEARFQNQEKQQEIDLLSADKKISDIENKRQSQISTLVSVLLGAVLLFAVFLITRIRIIRKQNTLIEAQKLEVTLQKEMIEEKSREIVDSITYAKRIQKAAMPDVRSLGDSLKNVFVTYLPKDHLSGDFYWFGKMKDHIGKERVLLALGDCTGHGVPGALLSILGINYLNVSRTAENIASPADMLNFLNDGIYTTFQTSESEIRDGMDIVIVAIDYEDKSILYAAAKNPIYLVRGTEITMLKGDSFAIGKGSGSDVQVNFQLYSANFQEGDRLYLFSDGYADQFGGDKGKKYSSKRLRTMLAELSAVPFQQQQQKLESEFYTWKKSFEQLDDVSFIGVQL